MAVSLLGRLLAARITPYEKLYAFVLLASACIAFALLASFFIMFLIKSEPILCKEGLAVFVSSAWYAIEGKPESEKYGLLPAIIGTIYVAAIAVLVAAPLAVGLAIFTLEYAPKPLQQLLIILTDSMAALPTIVYGLWGAQSLAPMLKYAVMDPLYKLLGWLPLFGYKPETGYCIFTAGVLMGIMVVPYATSLVREAYALIPRQFRECLYALGASKSEVIVVQLKYVKPVIIAALLLGFGRAAGETVAVSLVVGNALTVPISIFQPGSTISSLIANQYGNAYLYHYMESALFAGGLTLLILGLCINIIGVQLMMRWLKHVG